jgi:hypothetical protein
MIRITVQVGLVLGALVAGCAASGTAVRSAETPAPTPAPTVTTQTPAPTPAPTATTQTPAPTNGKPGDAKALLREAFAAIEKGQLDQAHALLEQARASMGADHDLDLQAASVALGIFTNKGDYEAAAHALLDAIRRHGAEPKDSVLFVLHNWLAIVREAEGDLPGAILESAERTAVGYEGTWQPAAERLQLTRFKDDWHRAYLFRMYAEQLTGSRREAALMAAEQARKDYVAAGGYADSIAVLDALFAMYDRRWDDVRAAVRRVDIAKDDDEEDLYLLFSALDATGDHEAAATIRRHIEQNPPSWGVWRSWLKSDTDGTPTAMKRFSPRYPTGKRP